MILSLLAIIAGIFFLIISADKFIDGATIVAQYFKISPLVIGLTIVALGTSLPELLVSLFAAINGNPKLAIGNAIGSNITNIGLVLGLTAIIMPIEVKSSILKKEFPILTLIMLLSFICVNDLELTYYDGYILLFCLIILICWLIYTGIKSGKNEALTEEFTIELSAAKTPISSGLTWLLIGMILMPISSKIIVWGAVNVAQYLGISQLVIGLTIIAIGTSLPELVASIVSMAKKEPDIALGNVMGSNMFNLLGVLGLSTSIHPAKLMPIFITRDFLTMVLLSLLLFIFAYGFKKPGRINRFEGSCLLVGYVAYLFTLYFTA